MERNWNDLLLREYRPEPAVRLEVHEVPRPSAPVVDVHNHLGRRMDVNELVVSSGQGRLVGQGRRRSGGGDGRVERTDHRKPRW